MFLRQSSTKIWTFQALLHNVGFEVRERRNLSITQQKRIEIWDLNSVRECSQTFFYDAKTYKILKFTSYRITYDVWQAEKITYSRSNPSNQESLSTLQTILQ